MTPGITDIKKYYNAKLDYFRKDIARRNPRHQRVYFRLKNLIRPSGKRVLRNVLDLGCGVGITSLMSAQLGAHVTSVDIAEDLIREAQTTMNHENIDYIVADATQLHLNRKFDLILLVDIVEHVINIGRLCEVVKAHSHPSTLIYANIPTGQYISYMRENFPDSLQLVDHALNTTTVLYFFNTIDFTIRELTTYGIDASHQYTDFVFVTKESIREKHNQFGKRLSEASQSRDVA